MNNDDAKKIKKDFPILQDPNLAYLDNAASTQKPKAVIDATSRYYETSNANIHRGVYKLSQEATQQYEDAHKTVAEFINAKHTEEIIFTRGTTESINLLSHTLKSLIGNRKEIVLSELEHHSNLVPWQQFAKEHSLTIRFIEITPNYTLDYDQAAQIINENTAIVSIGHVSNALGTVNDIKKICSLAKSKGALSIVDGAQGASHLPVNVADIGCDFYCFSGHKIMGPTGIGVLYGRKELLEQMPPFLYGGDMIKKVTYKDATWNDLPMKFEAGTPNIAGAVGLSAAIKYLQAIGMDNIAAWEKELLKYATEKLTAIDEVELISAGSDHSAGILSFNVKGAHAHDVASILDMNGVAIRGGHHCAMPLMHKLCLQGTSRASFYAYNTYEDIDKLVEGIQEVIKTFGG